MATVERKPFNFRTDSDVLESAKTIFKRQNLTVTRALNLFLERVVEDPEAAREFLEVEDPTDKVFKELQKEILEGYKDYQAGKVHSISEAREIARSWN